VKKGTKIAIGIGFALVIGIIVYFIVKTVKGDKQSEQPIANDQTFQLKAYKAPMLEKQMKIRELIIK
jgi:hypothetical protein